jgi:tetratricopeptide (TPR) repeat protein
MRNTILVVSALLSATSPALSAPPAATVSGKPEEVESGEGSRATGARERRAPSRRWLRAPLTDEELAALEKKIEEDPSNLELRETALQHYLKFFGRGDREKTRGRNVHVLWVIAHAPESDLAGRPEAHVLRALEPDLFPEAADLWRRQAQAHSRDARVLGNAATFFVNNDNAAALEMYAAAAALEPDNPRWRQRTAHVQTLEARSRRDPAAAQAALANYERALEHEPNDIKRTSLLRDAAVAALTVENDEKAERYAKEVLRHTENQPPELSDGYGVHEGHRVLGHVALRRGDVAGAKSHLLAAGAVSGAPSLDTFGPELTLAKELLARGETEAVIQYLTSIRRFWAGQGELLDGWIASIRAGQHPDLDRWAGLR